MSNLAIKQNTKLTHKEYFALEEELKEKFEYIAGKVFAMAGGSLLHSLIGKNTTTALDLLLRNTSCTAFNSDTKLYIKEIDSFFYPDAMMICDKVDLQQVAIESPQIIIEVLSDSTEAYDRGKKFANYRLIPTLQTYMMLHQDKPLAEVYQRTEDNAWLLREYAGLETIIPLNKEIKLAIADLYWGIEFKDSATLKLKQKPNQFRGQ